MSLFCIFVQLTHLSMKKFTVLFALLVILASCNDAPKEADNSQATQPETAEAESTNPTPDPLGDPCVLSGQDIAAMLQLDDLSDGRPNGINGETMKACDYGGKEGNVSISLQRYNDRTIEKKSVEKAYEGDLAKESDKLTYQEVEGSVGDQMIYMFGKSGPNNVYKIRWRYGNHTEKTVKFQSSKQYDSAQKLEQLKQIAAKLK